MKRVITLIVLGWAAGCCSAWAEEPSARDIERDVKAQFEQMHEAVDTMSQGHPNMLQLAKTFRLTLFHVKKLGCKADGPLSYICDVEVDIESTSQARSKQVAPVRMVKTESGWKAYAV